MSESSTSITLLERARNREEDAWHRLVSIFSPMVYRWCRRCGWGPEDAADVSQEVFCSVAGAIDRFEANGRPGAFRSWLWTITRNRIRNLARDQLGRPKARGGSSAQQFLGKLQFDDDDVLEEESDNDHRLLVQQAIRLIETEFEPQTVEIFLRIVAEDQSVDAVAAQMSVSSAAIYQAKSRVLRRLRQELGGLN